MYLKLMNLVGRLNALFKKQQTLIFLVHNFQGVVQESIIVILLQITALGEKTLILFINYR
jgi:hypothetical protein